MTDLWSGFQTMTADECRALLRSTEIGRVALSAGALPVVLPVHYVLDGHRLVLRTPGHHEVSSSLDGQIVGFEADQLDLAEGAGWCVTVTGPVRVLDPVLHVEPVHRWFLEGSLLELRTDIIAGHRVMV